MNYGLALSLGIERHLADLQARSSRYNDVVRSSLSTNEERDQVDGSRGTGGSGEEGDGGEVGIEERALRMAVEEMYGESGRRWRPWAANGKAIRIGEIILLVDSDTFVPEVCSYVSSTVELIIMVVKI
jgi:hypothetical protein